MNLNRLQRATVFLALCAVTYVPFLSFAQEATPPNPREDELSTLIDERSKAIDALEAEIAQYQGQLKQLDGAKKTLQNEISALDITRKKLTADLSVTENKITKTNYELQSLATDITDKEGRIQDNRAAIAQGIRTVNEYDQHSFVENLLAADSFVNAWEDLDAVASFQDALHTRIETLINMKSDLQDKQAESTRIKNQLTALRAQQSNQKKVIEYNANEKNALLKTTKNSEANYQKLLQEKTALRDAFEQELLDFESELKLLKDPSSIPDARFGELDWPLDSVFITQYFGNTQFAREHPQAYNGTGHNGIDLRASIGTPVKVARSGEVLGTGNTDTVCPGASYGKWVFLRHDNGLSTLYAHLSVISVSTGDSVQNGSAIGYSGNTGYTTGPHLHFTVYASQGVEILDRKSKVCGGTYRMPVADLRAYLNPLSYLPKLP